MAQRDLPGEWESKLLDQGFEYRGKASASALAKMAEVSPTAVLRIIHREGSDPDTIVRVGSALRDPQWVADWVGVSWSGRRVDPPAEWHLLDDDEREVLVRAMKLFIRGRGDSGADGLAQKIGGIADRVGADGQSEDGGVPADPGQRERRVVKGRGGMDRSQAPHD